MWDQDSRNKSPRRKPVAAARSMACAISGLQHGLMRAMSASVQMISAINPLKDMDQLRIELDQFLFAAVRKAAGLKAPGLTEQ
jgi:hypothetical protein